MNSKKFVGFIFFDFGNNVLFVRVFYILNKVNLVSIVYVEKWVEFIFGFSLDYGWDVFNVWFFEKYLCLKLGCYVYVEVISVDKDVICFGC